MATDQSRGNDTSGVNEANEAPLPAVSESQEAWEAAPPRAKPFPGIAQSIGLLLLLVLLQVLLSIPLSIFGFQNHPLAAGLAILVSTVIVVALGFRKTGETPGEVFPLVGVRLATLLGMMVTVLGLFVLFAEFSSFLLRVFPPPKLFSRVMGDIVGGRQSYWESFATAVIVAPFSEELLFRGLLLHGFLRRYSAKKAILASGLLFALMHGNPWQFVPGLCLGILLGWCFVRTRSLIPCFWGHMLNNSIGLIIVAFQMKSPAPTADALQSAPLPHFLPVVSGIILAALGIGLLKGSFDRAAARLP